MDTPLEHIPDLPHLLLLLLAIALALGFEFVNGFHDTANAVATVIYTKSLTPGRAVALSGLLNFLGVFVGGTAVAMAVVHLLPTELLVSADANTSLAMVFSILLAAIAWNLGTWYFGLPASSSHTLIGAIVGVDLAATLQAGHFGEGLSWHAIEHVGLALLCSPLVGFALAVALMMAARKLIKNERVFSPADSDAPPPKWIRGLLIATCGGVSFTHGSSDGQKGIGLVMLILVALVPGHFALDLGHDLNVHHARNHAVAITQVLEPAHPECASPRAADSGACEALLHAQHLAVTLGQAQHVSDLAESARVEVRNDILQLEEGAGRLEDEAPSEAAAIGAHVAHISPLTSYAPTWVILAIALALGLGTMVGWKRIVVTVGEKIGKQHLSYGQGAVAELVAVITIGLSSRFGLPVSTTHVLSSGIAGAMTADGAGVQPATVRKILLAWVLTLPVAMLLSGGLFLLLTWLF